MHVHDAVVVLRYFQCSARTIARHMTVPREAHVCALMTLMKYIMHTKHRGLLIAPKDMWSAGYKFKIHCRSDSDYATNPGDQKSILGGLVFVNDIPISF
jgi:hypothetical protein